MLESIDSLSLKHRQASQPSQQALDGRLIVSSRDAQMCSNFHPFAHHSNPSQFTSSSPLILFQFINTLSTSPTTPTRSFFNICRMVFSSTTLHSLSILQSSIQCREGFNTTPTFMHYSQVTIYLKGNETSNFAMPTLPCSPPSSTWTWIASINIVDVFHLGLPCPHSYQHIMYTLRIDVQWAFYIPLS